MSDDTDHLARLFAEAVPEIAAGTVEIKAIARKPGYRSKLALNTAALEGIHSQILQRGHQSRSIIPQLPHRGVVRRVM